MLTMNTACALEVRREQASSRVFCVWSAFFLCHDLFLCPPHTLLWLPEMVVLRGLHVKVIPMDSHSHRLLGLVGEA